MIESDTIKLLRQCDAGVKMGIKSIDDVYDYVKNEEFKNALIECKKQHLELQNQIESLLHEYHDEGKNINPIAQAMSWMKTKMKLGINDSDASIASLMTDGSNMGVKSLNKYLNEFEAAEEKVKDITKKLINEEEKLTIKIRKFL